MFLEGGGKNERQKETIRGESKGRGLTKLLFGKRRPIRNRRRAGRGSTGLPNETVKGKA